MSLSKEEPGGPRRSHRECPGAGQIRRTGPARRRTALAAVAMARWLGCCWWRSCEARGRGGPRSTWHDRWRVGSPVRRPPASAGVEVTTRRVTVVQDAGTSVLVHRVETALVVRTRKWPVLGPQTISNTRTARDNCGKRTPS